MKKCSRSRLNQWADVTFNEMKKYFAILINMGLRIRKNMSAYWDTKPQQVIRVYSRTMAPKSFLNIHCILLVNKVQVLRRGQPGYDSWSNIRYLFDQLNKMFQVLL